MRILSYEGSASVRFLSKEFDVTKPTIRQDLEKLEGKGMIVREHGGAYIKRNNSFNNSPELGDSLENKKTHAIAGRAASLVHDGDTIIIGAGDISIDLASCLAASRKLTVVTNSLHVARILGTEFTNDVMVTGGLLRSEEMYLGGETAAALFPRIHAEKLFLCPAGTDPEAGISCASLIDLPVHEAMMSSAKETVLLVDSAKVGFKAFARLCDINMAKTLITDSEADVQSLEHIKTKGVEVLIAE